MASAYSKPFSKKRNGQNYFNEAKFKVKSPEELEELEVDVIQKVKHKKYFQGT